MKKSAISLSLLLLLGATTLTACNSGDVKPLVIDGKDVLFSYGDKNFTADDLLGNEGSYTYSFLKSEEGARELYNAIEKAIIQQEVEVDDNIKNAVAFKMDEWKEKVSTYATENGLTERMAEKALLAQEGFETRKDLEDSYILAEQKTQLNKNYQANNLEPKVKDGKIDINEASLLKDYVSNATPMIMKHVLVKTADTGNVFAQANITEQESIKLGTVVKRLALGNKTSNSFAEVAVDESDDGSAKNGGNLGIVDEYTSFVNEFKLGVYSSIAYNAKASGDTEKYNQVVSSLSLDKTMFEADGIYETVDYIVVEDVVKDLIDNAHSVGNQVPGKDEDYSRFPRNIAFNKYFNFSGFKYLKVNDKTALAGSGNENDVRTNDQGFVVDENNNPIVVTRSEYGIHFISVTWSSLDHTLEDSVEYFMTNLNLDGIENGYYKNPLFNKGYTESVATLEKNRKTEIEGRVTNFLQGGYASSVSADEQIMAYKMFKAYQSKVNVNDEEIAKAVNDYVDLKLAAHATKVNNAIESTLDTYIRKVEADISLHEEIYGNK